MTCNLIILSSLQLKNVCGRTRKRNAHLSSLLAIGLLASENDILFTICSSLKIKLKNESFKALKIINTLVLKIVIKKYIKIFPQIVAPPRVR